MSKEQVIKDKLALIAKNAITANIDRIAEQIAEEVYEMFEPASIDEPGPRGKEGCFSIDKPGVRELEKVLSESGKVISF